MRQTQQLQLSFIIINLLCSSVLTAFVPMFTNGIYQLGKDGNDCVLKSTDGSVDWNYTAGLNLGPNDCTPLGLPNLGSNYILLQINANSKILTPQNDYVGNSFPMNPISDSDVADGFLVLGLTYLAGGTDNGKLSRGWYLGAKNADGTKWGGITYVSHSICATKHIVLQVSTKPCLRLVGTSGETTVSGDNVFLTISRLGSFPVEAAIASTADTCNLTPADKIGNFDPAAVCPEEEEEEEEEEGPNEEESEEVGEVEENDPVTVSASGLSGGQIAGIVVGSVTATSVLLGIAIWKFFAYQKYKAVKSQLVTIHPISE